MVSALPARNACEHDPRIYLFPSRPLSKAPDSDNSTATRRRLPHIHCAATENNMSDQKRAKEFFSGLFLTAGVSLG